MNKLPNFRASISLSALCLATLPLVFACASGGEASKTSGGTLDAAIASITDDDLMKHIEVLASDEYEGRGPGTEGGRKTVDYLVEQFSSLGLAPGNPDGTYVQRVPLTGYTVTSSASFNTAGGVFELQFPNDYVATTKHTDPRIEIANSEIVFVGYGVVAPEYDWDDFKDVDVAGKTVVMLVNDPPIADPANPSRLDDSMFKGRAMTYYGRWTYKYEIAAEKGAAAVLVVHETGPAGYPYEVISGSWGRENFDIASDGASDRAKVEGWIPANVAEELAASCGLNFAELKQAALSRGFRPVTLPGARANFHLDVATRTVESSNVVALLEGTDPAKRDELIVFTAHWDHLGRDPEREGDQIFNGALDNASGTAALIELAQALQLVEQPLDRSFLFLAVTAEEKGLLGSKYYAQHPLYPLEKTLANINMDGINPYGRTSDVVSIGYGFTTLEDLLVEHAAAQGRTVVPDAEPEKGFYFRSDHFSFAKQGVPALYGESGVEYIGRAPGWGQARRDQYTANDYHKVSDEVKDDWDFSGGIEDVELYLRIGVSVSQDDEYPTWKPGTEFKAVREASLGN